MNAPRIKTDVAKCRAKRRYSDEMTARADGTTLISGGHTSATQMFCYRCTHCRGWHLTRNRQPSAAITGELTFAPRKKPV